MSTETSTAGPVTRAAQYALMLGIVAFAGIPLIWMALTSFQPLTNLLGVQMKAFAFGDMSLDAYREIIFDSDFGRWFVNSVLVCTAVVAANLVFDSLVAYPLARMRFRGSNVVFLLILGAVMVPAQVIIVPLYLMMKDLGLLNSYVALIAPYAVSPTGIFLLRQHFMTIPREIDEAALVDGASRLRILVRIILPNSLAALGTVAVLKFMWTWGEFAWPSLAVNSSQLRTIPVGLAGLRSQFGTEWHLLMAGSTLAVIPVIIAFACLQRLFIRGVTAGAVKG